jgi:hypothetical protein
MRLYRVGVSLLLTMHAAGSLACEPLMDGLAYESALASYTASELSPEALSLRPLEVAQDWIEAPPAAAPNPLGNQLVALGNESLDDIRGGFEFPDTPLKLSFGFERAVFVNGELVASTVLNVKDLQWASAGVSGATQPQVLPSAATAGAVGVIQNGMGNSIPAQISANVSGTVIQNTLDNQSIQTITTINAAINSVQVLRAMSMQSVQAAVENGVVSSLRR